jgi:hypothetical protein
MVRDANPGASDEQLKALTAKAKEANGFPGEGIPTPYASVLIPQLDNPPVSPPGTVGPTTTLSAGSSYRAAQGDSKYGPDKTSGFRLGEGAMSRTDFGAKIGPKDPQAANSLAGLEALRAKYGPSPDDPKTALEDLKRGDSKSVVRSVNDLSPQGAGKFFAQATPEQLGACLSSLGQASAAERRQNIPQFLDAMAKAQPPCQLSKDVLSKIDDSALRSLAAYPADGSPGSQALVSSGLLGELAQRAENNPKNAMSALEGLSRLSSSELPGAMKQLGLTQEKLTSWIGAASGTDPMSAKGGWANPETVQRLAVKLAGQPDGAGFATATALVSTTLSSKASKGLQTDTGLQHTLEDLLQTAQGKDVPNGQKAAVAASMVNSGIFSHPSLLTPELRMGATNLIGSAPQEFVGLYAGRDQFDAGIDQRELGKLSSMVTALGFTGPESNRNAFNSLWGNLVGDHLKGAVQHGSKVESQTAGMLFNVYTEGARAAQTGHDAKVKALQDLLGFAASGIGGGFSWKVGDFNLVSPLKEEGKGLVSDVAKYLVGDNPEASKACASLQDYLLKEAGTYAKQQGLDPEEWASVRGYFVQGREVGRAY